MRPARLNPLFLKPSQRLALRQQRLLLTQHLALNQARAQQASQEDLEWMLWAAAEEWDRVETQPTH
jgi:hypothetical protein